MTRRTNTSDAFLAKRLAHAEALFDLHSSNMNRSVALSIQRRLSSVRQELERRAACLSRVRVREETIL